MLLLRWIVGKNRRRPPSWRGWSCSDVEKTGLKYALRVIVNDVELPELPEGYEYWVSTDNNLVSIDYLGDEDHSAIELVWLAFNDKHRHWRWRYGDNDESPDWKVGKATPSKFINIVARHRMGLDE